MIVPIVDFQLIDCSPPRNERLATFLIPGGMCVFFFRVGLYAFYEMTLLKISSEFKFINVVIMFFFLGSGIYYACWRLMEKETFMMAVTAHAYLLIICYGLLTYGL